MRAPFRCLVLAAGLVGTAWAQALTARWRGGEIAVAATGLNFLAGRAMERLKNGGAVVFELELSLATETSTGLRRRTAELCAVSYDLWEEKFSVTRLRSPRKSASHLSAEAAQAWCLDTLGLVAFEGRDAKPFWLRLEVRAPELGEEPVVDADGISLTGLIDRLSRPGRRPQQRWLLEAGPLRAQDLKR